MKKVILRCVLLILTLGWFSREPLLAVKIIEPEDGEEHAHFFGRTFLSNNRKPNPDETGKPDDLTWRKEGASVQVEEHYHLNQSLSTPHPTFKGAIQDLEQRVKGKPGWTDVIKFYKAVNQHGNKAKHHFRRSHQGQ